MTASGTKGKLRSDAQANRHRILAVARDALTADPEVSLNSIAKTADVGAGTLYRHFPNREALLIAVYRKEIDDLVAAGPALLTQHEPIAAFRMWCDRFAEFGRMKRGVADSLRAIISDQDVRDFYGPMVDAVRQMLAACEAAGSICSGFDAEDTLILLSSVLRIAPSPQSEAQARRLVSFIINGLTAENNDAPTGHAAKYP
jgi:AcrR family transcriptional regulator